MRLISDFHDYYDLGLSQGQDERVTFERKTSFQFTNLNSDELPWSAYLPTLRIRAQKQSASDFKPQWLLELGSGHTEKLDWICREAFVIIAGKAYAVWVRDNALSSLLGDQKREAVGGINPEQVLAALIREAKSLGLEKNIKDQPVISQTNPENLWKKDRQRFIDYQQRKEKFLQRDFTELHLALGSPVLFLAPPKVFLGRNLSDQVRKAVEQGASQNKNTLVVVNPRLSDFGLVATLDPYSCFQAISQFIEGVVPGQQMPMVEISDRSKVEKKGFDPVYGFRKRPAQS